MVPIDETAALLIAVKGMSYFSVRRGFVEDGKGPKVGRAAAWRIRR